MLMENDHKNNYVMAIVLRLFWLFNYDAKLPTLLGGNSKLTKRVILNHKNSIYSSYSHLQFKKMRTCGVQNFYRNCLTNNSTFSCFLLTSGVAHADGE